MMMIFVALSFFSVKMVLFRFRPCALSCLHGPNGLPIETPLPLVVTAPYLGTAIHWGFWEAGIVFVIIVVAISLVLIAITL